MSDVGDLDSLVDIFYRLSTPFSLRSIRFLSFAFPPTSFASYYGSGYFSMYTNSPLYDG